MAYDAFISYSHAADGQLAPAIQSALHRLAKPFYRMRDFDWQATIAIPALLAGRFREEPL